jgi:hypothetical protein
MADGRSTAPSPTGSWSPTTRGSSPYLLEPACLSAWSGLPCHALLPNDGRGGHCLIPHGHSYYPARLRESPEGGAGPRALLLVWEKTISIIPNGPWFYGGSLGRQDPEDHALVRFEHEVPHVKRACRTSSNQVSRLFGSRRSLVTLTCVKGVRALANQGRDELAGVGAGEAGARGAVPLHRRADRPRFGGGRGSHPCRSSP